MTARYPTTFASLLALLLGCGSSDGPTTPQEPLVPALESIPFALLGPGKIAFDRVSLLGDKTYQATYIVDATAATSSHTGDTLFALGPALSPDGRRLAYATEANHSLYDVYVVNIDGSGAQHLTSFLTQEGSPSWTPDGARILMVASISRNSYLPNIFSQSLGTPSDVIQHTHFPLPAAPCPAFFDNDVTISASPQGLLAFACELREIDILSADGSLSASYKPVRHNSGDVPNVFSAQWSHDGNHLAFIETMSDSAAGYTLSAVSVKMMNADGTNVTTVATIASGAGSDANFRSLSGLNNLSLCWTADGAHLVFNLPEHPAVGHLWVVRPDGSGLTKLTSAPDVYDRSVSCSRS